MKAERVKLLKRAILGLLIFISIPYFLPLLSQNKIVFEGYEFNPKGLNFIAVSQVHNTRNFIGIIKYKKVSGGFFVITQPKYIYGAKTGIYVFKKEKTFTIKKVVKKGYSEFACELKLKKLFNNARCYDGLTKEVYVLDSLFIVKNKEYSLFDSVMIEKLKNKTGNKKSGSS